MFLAIMWDKTVGFFYFCYNAKNKSNNNLKDVFERLKT